MLKFLLIFISQVFFINSNPVVQPSSKSLTFENIAFIKLGTYRGFTDDGAEYQKTYFISRSSRPSWAESRSLCQSFNMDHLTIETKAEEENYLYLLNSNLRTASNGYFWTDAMTVTPKTQTEWFWARTGKKISFPISWSTANPYTDYCLSIFKHNINDNFLFGSDDCNSKRSASCQKIDLLIP